MEVMFGGSSVDCASGGGEKPRFDTKFGDILPHGHRRQFVFLVSYWRDVVAFEEFANKKRKHQLEGTRKTVEQSTLRGKHCFNRTSAKEVRR